MKLCTDFDAVPGTRDFDEQLIPAVTATRLGAIARPKGLSVLSDLALRDRLVAQLEQERADPEGYLRAYPAIYRLAAASHILGEANPWAELLDVPGTRSRLLSGWGFVEHYRLAAQLLGWASPELDPEEVFAPAGSFNNTSSWKRERLELLRWSLRADRPASADEADYTLRALLGAGQFCLAAKLGALALELLVPQLGHDPGAYFETAAVEPVWVRRRIEGSWSGDVQVQTKSSGRDVVASFRGATADEAVSGSLVAFGPHLSHAIETAHMVGKPWRTVLGRPDRKLRLVAELPKGVHFDPMASWLRPYLGAFEDTAVLIRRLLATYPEYDEVVCRFQWLVRQPGQRDRVLFEQTF